jgi:steroid delta-isomerase-like uncharacterized protein
MLSACGGEEKPPQTPATPAATTPAPTAAPTAEAPKEEPKPKETLAQLEEKTGRGIVDAMNAHDAKKLAGFYTESAVVKVAGMPDSTGRDAIAANMQKVFDAFPDFKTNAARVWAKGDVVVVEWAFNGTHQGDYFGIKGTEKKVGTQGVDVMWFTPEGQIKELHSYFDPATVMSQIGVSPMKARPIPAIPNKPEVFMTPGADEAKNADGVKALTAALENKKEADFVGGLADNVEYDDMTQPQGMKGKADGKKFFKEMTTGFPDAKHGITNTITVGDFVIVEGTMSGTHKGSFFGLPATKKPVNTKSVTIFQYKDGKMVKGWGYANGADLMMQLGKMPAPKAAGDKKPADAKAAPAAGDKKPADTKAAPKK